MTTTSTRCPTILHRNSVAPPPQAAVLRLPLTWFDMFWLYFHKIQRLLFYQYPCSTSHFLETIIPNLTNSLSITLQHYLPLAGNLYYPLDTDTDTGMPELRYVPGDSVSMTFAELSDDAVDFNSLIGNQARDADEFYYFVPDESLESETDSGFKKLPLLAIQVTLIPEKGICVGISNHHVAGDASSIVGFIKAWSAVSKLGEYPDNHTTPFYDRSVIKDPSGRANIYWNQMKVSKLGSYRINLPTNKLRSTFILQKNEIQRLKDLVFTKKQGLITHLSSFTVTIAYVWSCFAKSAADAGEEVDDNEPEFFGFAVDSRSRLDPPLPAAYFGNCVAFVSAESTHGAVKGSEGFVIAAEVIGNVISEKVNKKGELFRDADDWLVKYGPLVYKRMCGVAGSPKFDLYDTDFGWGKPVKFESVSIDGDVNNSISLCKSREFEGGLEIGVSLPKRKMDAFGTVFYNGLKM